METTVIFEDEAYRQLLPLTYWRTCFELRTGYGRLTDHITASLNGSEVSYYCRPIMAAVTAERFAQPVNRVPAGEAAVFINGRLLLTSPLDLGPLPSAQWQDGWLVALRANQEIFEKLSPQTWLDRVLLRQVLAGIPEHRFVQTPKLIGYPWDLVAANPDMLNFGWRRAGSPAGLDGRICQGVHLLNESAIHVGARTVLKPGVVLDAEHGAIYVGQDVTIAPNVSIEGPCYIGDGSLIQPGATLRDAMSIGPRCKVGGELESSIIHGFSNKQHDGFLGHSYVAEWVNLAADTVNSDLKNTYGTVRVPINGVEVESGQMFAGLTIGDHSKTGIGQMFPTGAVVGFGSNIATCEFAPKFVPSFTWLTATARKPYELGRCLEVAKRVMARRQTDMTAAQEALFRELPGLAEIAEAPALDIKAN
ncbi:MAG: hypothetical protein KA354_15855 [Phycisphaerae bacterium]|nr:hypothetical protein [Phycisphaerae bacterium]